MTLNSQQFDLLNYLEQEFYVYGHLPTADACADRSVCSADYYHSCFKKQEFRDALVSRGISYANLHSPKYSALSEEQLTAANVVFDLTDSRSRKKKLTDLGIPSQKWEAWLRDPGFQNYLRVRAENLLGDNQHEAHLALLDRVKSGDTNAIKYYNELTGYYVPQKQGEVDVVALVMRILEVVQKHVNDPVVQTAIAEELMAMATPAPVGALRRPALAASNVVDSEVVGM